MRMTTSSSKAGSWSWTAARRRPAATPPTSPGPCPSGGGSAPGRRGLRDRLGRQEKAIKAIKPGVNFKDIHLQTARLMADGLKGLGLMKGDTAEARGRGRPRLFFPHGLGHNLGLDVHDMEDYGENNVGYGEKVQRSSQFGLAYLRMARELKPGHVLTVEPGLYFIPPSSPVEEGKKHRTSSSTTPSRSSSTSAGPGFETTSLVTERGAGSSGAHPEDGGRHRKSLRS